MVHEPHKPLQNETPAQKDTVLSLADVAKAAGVSPATVSRVINEIPGVRTETERKVRAALETMNYTPLRSKRDRLTELTRIPSRFLRTGNIAALVLGGARDRLVQYPVMAAAVVGMQAAASDYGLRVILHDLPDPTKMSPLIENREIDGAVVFITSPIVMTSYEKDLTLLRERLPVVWALGMGVATSSVDHVTVDNVRIGHLGLEYLCAQECAEVAFVSLAPEWTSVRLRAQAFMTAAHDRKVPATAYLLCSDNWAAEPYGGRVVTAATPEDLVAKMAAAKPPPSGLFIGTDAWTAHLYPILHSHGLKPMRNVQIVSCDNETMRLSSLFPRPATIDPGSEQIGYLAVVRLVARLRQSDELPFMILTCPQLVPPPSPSSPGKSW